MPSTVLTGSQQKVLELLAPVVERNGFYLGGGTALAMQLRHRRSVDFDFFVPAAFDPSILLRQFPPCDVLQESRGTIEVMLNEVKVSFFQFPYPTLQPCIRQGIVNLASVPDIAAMKLSALAGRGSRKDFVDLYVIARQHHSLTECLTFFEKKFSTHKTDRYHLLRSVVYFDDAEKEPMPEMLIPLHWDDVKAFFIDKARTLQ